MRKLIYPMSISVDGYIADRNGQFDWAAPNADLHQHWNDHELTIDTLLHGGRMWAMMADYWPVADQDPKASKVERDFSGYWKRAKHVVFSRRLTEVGYGATLIRDNPVEAVRALKAQEGKDMEVGGPGIASVFIASGLIDEFWLYLHPVAVGSGKPYFQHLQGQLDLTLIGTQPFSDGVIQLRYAPR
ncbi:MAG TPA: dihydrofolate reductase family protein [Devosia sp.]|nr:dihydrofolate reductase family protein [Devosia sp.]